jgi:uncharacterized membrane protein YdbT with pleckstrin-like domain
MSEETRIWEGSSSQVLNFPVFIGSGLVAGLFLGGGILVGQHSGTAGALVAIAAIIPVLFAIYHALKVKSQRYELTTERLRLTRGILSKRTDEVEFYRVRDYVLFQPFILRLFGLSDLVIMTDDTVNPQVTLKAIPDAQKIKDEVRKHVEICRDKKRVRVAELEEGAQNI